MGVSADWASIALAMILMLAASEATSVLPWVHAYKTTLLSVAIYVALPVLAMTKLVQAIRERRG